jgi:hypothetical protein
MANIGAAKGRMHANGCQPTLPARARTYHKLWLGLLHQPQQNSASQCSAKTKIISRLLGHGMMVRRSTSTFWIEDEVTS